MRFIIIIIILLPTSFIDSVASDSTLFQKRLWGTYYGGLFEDKISSICSDNNNNIYISGVTNSTSGIAANNAFQPSFNGGPTDLFLSRFDSTGTRIWATYFGGINEEFSSDLIVDKFGDIILLASSNSPNLATAGTFQISNNGQTDVILAKFTADGDILWSTYFGGEEQDLGLGVAVDSMNNIVVVGSTKSISNISTTNSHQSVFAGGIEDGFIVKFNPGGIRLWSTYIGGEMSDGVLDIDIDSGSNIFVTGYTSSSINIATNSSHQSTYGGGAADAFVAKFNLGGKLIWGTYYGGSNNESGHSLKVDNNNNIIVGGGTNSTNKISTNGAHQLIAGGGESDAFVVKFNKNGNRIWSTYYGGELLDNESSIAVDYNNNIFLVGYTQSTTSIASTCTHQNFLRKEMDGFIAKFDSNGIRNWGTYFGGEKDDFMMDVKIDNSNNILVAGYTKSQSFIASPSSFQSNLSGDIDGFLSKFKDTILTNPRINPNGVLKICPGSSIVITASDSKNYIWSNGEITKSITVNKGGNYYVEIGEPGCNLKSEVVNVSLVESSVSVNGLPVLCQGGFIDLIASKGVKYSWSTGDTTQKIRISNPGTYIVDVTDSNNCTATSIPKTISEVTPIGDFSIGNDTSLCEGNDLKLIVNIPNSQYVWSTGEAKSCINVNSPGAYWVDVYYFSCPPKRASIEIEYFSTINYTTPNLITPNGDELNDAFIIEGKVPRIEIEVYNRWGNLVYKNEDYKNEWEADEVEPGIYYYNIKESKELCIEGKEGWLQIIK